MGLVSFLVAVVAGAALAGGVGAVVVAQNHPDKVMERQQEQLQEQGQPLKQASEPDVLDYGSR
ncbi:hypothetical protein ACFOWZ_38765 [Lentzea rhizosphaerae]|uniref:DUF2613 domain-containing protein n=1 Tax=Lentzea rhizosphaerae TaxID=2041025 RepID=A0ABV8C6U1_9PSEU